MISTLESALQSRKYDLVILFPITPQAMTPILELAWDTYKTPILAYAFSAHTECGHYYLGTSFYQAGVTLGNSIIEYVNDNKSYFDTLKTIPVVAYKSSFTTEQINRVKGALDVLRDDGRFTIMQEYEALGPEMCLAATETVLATYPDIEVFVTLIDSDVPGIYQALTSSKVSQYASIWSFDAISVVCRLMTEDGVDGFMQGSSFINHQYAGEALAEIIPTLVGASKQNVIIDFKPDEFEFLDSILGNFYTTVTPKNVKDYYTAQ
jgi:ABC-type sugar transport system substrate-binding protein